MAVDFSGSGVGRYREGFVVRFFPDTGDPWSGNFLPGLVSFHGVFAHPDRERVVVVAGGTAYVVSPNSKTCDRTFGAQISWASPVPSLDVLVLATLVDILIFERHGTLWCSRRISWDGFKDLRVENDVLSGRAYTPVSDDEWLPFELDLRTRRVKGGAC
jgi:hypothetical protein